MRIPARLVLTALLAVLSGCAGMTPAERSAAEPDILETVFRYQFQRGGASGQTEPAAYFLEVRGGDPSPELLKRFDGHRPPVHPASKAMVSDLAGVADPGTGEAGVLFSVDDLRWLEDGGVRVRGGYRRSDAQVDGNLYRVVREQGEWRVQADAMGALVGE